jgi:SAM-dependent methyltransferase
MKECSKAISRRLSDSRFIRRYFKGVGVDIGGAPDPLVLYKEFFPLMTSVKTWDLIDGDAQFMKGVSDGEYDFVFSSHCLEHLRDPFEGLKNWFRILKPGGFLVAALPDEDLYEQGLFPSTFNRDHKHTFTLNKANSWSKQSIDVLDLVRSLGSAAALEKIELLDETFRYDLPRFDQTSTPIAECGIELIIRKRTQAEIDNGGLVRVSAQPDRETRIHLNQYRDDQASLRRGNKDRAPFQNDAEI